MVFIGHPKRLPRIPLSVILMQIRIRQPAGPPGAGQSPGSVSWSPETMGRAGNKTGGAGERRLLFIR